MSRRLVNITLDNVHLLPDPCRSCGYWVLDPVADAVRSEGRPSRPTELDKEAWLSETLLEWGTCGLLAMVDDEPAGYVLFAPAAYVPRAARFATAPISPDAILLMTARLRDDHRGQGLGRLLVQGVARQAVRRGVRAIEAFGRPGRAGGETGCLLPLDYLLAVGFKTVRPHPQTPRLRMDIRSTVTWREDMETALERLLGSLPAPAILRPR